MSDGLGLRYFVLKPKGDSVHARASRAAMLLYAEIVESETPEMSVGIREWLAAIEDSDGQV